MLKPSPSLIALLVVIPWQALSGQSQWSFSKNQYDLRETYIDGQSNVFGVQCTTRLKFRCTKDGKCSTGYTYMEFTIAPVAKLSGFNFSYFEGPDADVGSRKLLSVVLDNHGQQNKFQVGLTGWYSADVDDGFVFGSGTPTKNKSGYMRKIIQEIIHGAETIEITVIDGKTPGKTITASFPLKDGLNGFKALLEGVN